MSAYRQRGRQALSMMLGLSLSVPLAIGTVTPALADTMSPSPEPTLEETPGAPEAPEESSAPTESPSELEEPEDDPTPEETENSEEPQALQADTNAGSGVVVTELTNGGPGGYHDNFIEITNTSDETVDVDGWEVYRCSGAGNRASGPQVTLEGELEAGEIILLAREHAQSSFTDDRSEERR